MCCVHVLSKNLKASSKVTAATGQTISAGFRQGVEDTVKRADEKPKVYGITLAFGPSSPTKTPPRREKAKRT
jgi:hypothetical protein